MSNCQIENLPPVNELLRDVEGVEVLEIPFPKPTDYNLHIVRPTGKLYRYGFLISPHSCSGGIKIHFDFGPDDKRSDFCYKVTCVTCVRDGPWFGVLRPSAKESAFYKWLGVEPQFPDFTELARKKFDETLVAFCREKDIEVLFIGEPLDCSSYSNRLKLEVAYASDALWFLLSKHSKQELAKGFKFIRSVAYDCDKPFGWSHNLR